MAPSELFAKMAAALDSNRKIRRAGRNGREVYLWVLRQVALRNSDGSIPREDVEDFDHVAEQLMCPPDDARDGFERCVAVALLSVTGDRCAIAGWDDDWGRRAMSNGERQARFREKHKAHATLQEPQPVARNERVVTRNETVTDNAGEERREEESRERRVTENAPTALALEPPGPKQRRKREQKPETPCPDDLAPNERQRSRAAALGVDADQQFRLFKAHHGSRDQRFRDWSQAFDKWLENAPRYGPTPRPSDRPPPTSTRLTLEDAR